MDYIEGQAGVGVSAYSLVDALRVALGKTANRDEASKSFNKLRATRSVLQNLQNVTISRRCGEHETPALTTEEQVHVVIDSKSYNSIAAEFKAQHMETILSMLPSSAGVTAVQRRPLPSYFDSLDCVTRGAGNGQYSGVARDYPSFKDFMVEMQAAEGTHFNMTHREEQTGYLVLQLSCLFGGKPKWEERKARGALQATDFKRAASAGHSIKVDCPAILTARISLRYATVLGLFPNSAGKGGPIGIDDKRIPVSMILGHCGHQPNTAMDLNSLPLDPRYIYMYITNH